MSWEDCAIVECEELLLPTREFLQIFKERGIPMSPDYLVETERCGNRFVYRWKRKDGEQNSANGAN